MRAPPCTHAACADVRHRAAAAEKVSVSGYGGGLRLRRRRERERWQAARGEHGHMGWRRMCECARIGCCMPPAAHRRCTTSRARADRLTVAAFHCAESSHTAVFRVDIGAVCCRALLAAFPASIDLAPGRRWADAAQRSGRSPAAEQNRRADGTEPRGPVPFSWPELERRGVGRVSFERWLRAGWCAVLCTAIADV